MSSLSYEHRFSALPIASLPCSDGQEWEWDGVRFEVLHPLAAQYLAPTRKTNDMSCVMKVSNAFGDVLLTSDIEALSEQALLTRHAGRMRVAVDDESDGERVVIRTNLGEHRQVHQQGVATGGGIVNFDHRDSAGIPLGGDLGGIRTTR